MPGSYAETEDVAQETLVRTWRNVDRFEGRSALRSSVYRIATDVCLDALASGGGQALPMDLSGPRPHSRRAAHRQAGSPPSGPIRPRRAQAG
ncbi:sigma factor [Streptomyces exfoliatus]